MISSEPQKLDILDLHMRLPHEVEADRTLQRVANLLEYLSKSVLG